MNDEEEKKKKKRNGIRDVDGIYVVSQEGEMGQHSRRHAFCKRLATFLVGSAFVNKSPPIQAFRLCRAATYRNHQCFFVVLQVVNVYYYGFMVAETFMTSTTAIKCQPR